AFMPVALAARKWPASCAITNRAMATTAMRPPIMDTTYSRRRSSRSHQFGRQGPGLCVGGQHLVDGRQLRLPCRPLQRLCHHVDDSQEADLAGEECLHRHFVGGVEDAGGGAAPAGGVEGEVDRLELEGPPDERERLSQPVDALRIR